MKLPIDAFDFSAEANSTLKGLNKDQTEKFLSAMETIWTILLHVYDGRSLAFLSQDSWDIVQNFILGGSGAAILFVIEGGGPIIELRRRNWLGFRVGAVSYASATIH